MVDISPGSHHHLECWNHLVTGGAVAGRTEQPEECIIHFMANFVKIICQNGVKCYLDLPHVVSFTEKDVTLDIERVAHLPQATVAATTLQTILVPKGIC